MHFSYSRLLCKYEIYWIHLYSSLYAWPHAKRRQWKGWATGLALFLSAFMRDLWISCIDLFKWLFITDSQQEFFKICWKKSQTNKIISVLWSIKHYILPAGPFPTSPLHWSIIPRCRDLNFLSECIINMSQSQVRSGNAFMQWKEKLLKIKMSEMHSTWHSHESNACIFWLVNQYSNQLSFALDINS